MGHLTLDELGLAETQTSELGHEHAELVAATLDVDVPDDGTLPLLWHWAYFNPVVPSAHLGPDGHPVRHGVLLAQYPRRMWVGGDVRTAEPLRLDTPATRRTRLVDSTVKHGSTGDLLLVTLEHTVDQGGAEAVTERQDVVYRAAGGRTAPPGPDADLSGLAGEWTETVTPTRPLLLRFSAITFNAHRIHYDAEYATGEEGYPGLVVHGPLTATLLAASAARHLGRALTSFSFRASAPLFVDQPITITGTLAGDEAAMTATRVDGATAMTATAR